MLNVETITLKGWFGSYTGARRKSANRGGHRPLKQESFDSFLFYEKMRNPQTTSRSTVLEFSLIPSQADCGLFESGFWHINQALTSQLTPREKESSLYEEDRDEHQFLLLERSSTAESKEIPSQRIITLRPCRELAFEPDPPGPDMSSQLLLQAYRLSLPVSRTPEVSTKKEGTFLSNQWVALNRNLKGELPVKGSMRRQRTRLLKGKMLTIVTWLMVMIFVVGIGLSVAQQTNQNPKGAEVRNVTFDSNTKSATVEVVNTSTKDITAYSIAYDISYRDGHHEKAERVVEYLQGIIASQQKLGVNWSGEGVFHPGETRKEVFQFGGQTKDNHVLTVNAVVDVVIYMDQTAEVGNDEPFKLLISDRTATARAAKDMAAILENALADKSDLHPLRTVSIQLHHLVKESTGSLPARAEIQSLIDNLAKAQANGGTDERKYITDTLAEKNQQAVLTVQQAQIRGQQ